MQGLSAPGNGKGSSEHVPLGASVCQRPPTDHVEWFLSMLRFDSRETVNALGVMQIRNNQMNMALRVSDPVPRQSLENHEYVLIYASEIENGHQS